VTEKISDETRFFGKVTAGVTHDLQNIFAIIKETGGLMEDILLMNKGAELPFIEKFQKCLSTIKGQTVRGSELTSSLNEFAHTPDHDEKDVDIFQTSHMIIKLIHRKLKNCNITIHVDKPDVPATLKTSAVKFEIALLSAIDTLMSQLSSGSSMQITPEKSDQTVEVKIICKDKSPDADLPNRIQVSEQWACLQDTLKRINGCATADKDTHGIILRFNT